MNETIAMFQTYARMVWRYRWIALVGAGLICIGGWLLVLSLPNQYQASAKVFMDTRSLLDPVLSGIAIQSNVREQAARMVRRTLLARPNLESVARETDMHLKAETERELEALLRALGKTIRVSGTPRDNIFEISYEHESPATATRVVESLLNLFMERSLGESRRDTTTTREFVNRQIRHYEAKLAEAENRLKQFKQEHVGMMPSEGRDYFQRLQDIAGRLAAAELRLQEVQNRRDALQRQLQGEEPTFGFGPETAVNAQGAPSPVDQRIAKLEADLDSLLLHYTEEHPDVVATRRLLEELEGRRRQIGEAQGAGAQAATSENPIHQSLRVNLGQAEAEIAALQTRVEEYRRRKAELERMVDTIPEVEAQLKRLNRDYAIHKRNYEELVARREALQLANDASQSTDEVQFRVVEPPRRPMIPVGPDRPKLNLTVFVLGVGGGTGFAWLFAMLRPGVYSRHQLAELAGRPVLGAVSRVWLPRMRLKRRLELCAFGLGSAALFGLLAGLLVLDPGQVDVLTKLQALRGTLS